VELDTIFAQGSLGVGLVRPFRANRGKLQVPSAGSSTTRLWRSAQDDN